MAGTPTRADYTGGVMARTIASLLLISLLAPVAFAAELPAKGKLLVATEQVRGEVFARTVILLLHYDKDGAMGIVINRPTDIPPAEVLTSAEAFANYDGELFWGGPVQMDSLWALVRDDESPTGSDVNSIVANVHHVPIDDAIDRLPADPGTVRFYIGYAGWAPGQLDGEMARGDWNVVSATGAMVFAEEPRALWDELAIRAPEYSVRMEPVPGGARGSYLISRVESTGVKWSRAR